MNILLGDFSVMPDFKTVDIDNQTLNNHYRHLNLQLSRICGISLSVRINSELDSDFSIDPKIIRADWLFSTWYETSSAKICILFPWPQYMQDVGLKEDGKAGLQRKITACYKLRENGTDEETLKDINEIIEGLSTVFAKEHEHIYGKRTTT